MTEEIQEQISAFIDGELPEAEAELLVRRLATDAALRAEAERQMRLSQAIRGEASVADAGFSARVLAAIHDEPTLDEAAEAPPAAPAHRGSWMRMAAGGGIVAGVAAIALLALPDAVQSPTIEAQTADTVSEPAAGLPDTAESCEYTVPEQINDSGLVSANPELAAYYLSHSVNSPSIAPGSGRARILSTEGNSDTAESETDDAADDAQEASR
ncbi:MAG: sigma-E factor negative regulatory protein [Pseudomonadota bacterium]